MKDIFDTLGLDPTGENQAPETDIPPVPYTDYRQQLNTAILDQDPRPAPKSDSFGDDILDVLGEFSAAANRTVAGGLDALGPNAINSAFALAGSDRRIPTATDSLASVGIGEGGYMDEGWQRDAVQAAGQTAVVGGSLVPVARQAGAIGSVGLDLLGVGSSSITTPLRHGATQLADTASQAFSRQPSLTDVEIPLKRRSGDVSSFGYDLNPQGVVVKAPEQAEAARQGFDKDFVTALRDAPEKAREQVRRMVAVVERGKQNYKAKRFRPQSVMGEAVANRVRVVYGANRSAADRLEVVAESLKGRPVDVAPAMDQFIADLDGMGITLDPQTLKPIFKGSDVEDLSGIEGFVSRTIKRLREADAPDAYGVHRMKRIIDEGMSYGQKEEGLEGKALLVVKSLRRNLDAILDGQFPAYDQVNTQYAETIEALNALQDIAGKRINLIGDNAASALGTLSRRVLSNAQSRVPLEEALEQLDSVARKYVTPGTDVAPYRSGANRTAYNSGVTLDDLDDDLMLQIQVANDLDDFFGTAAKTSFKGEIINAGAALEASQQGMASAGVNALGRWLKQKRGITDEAALKALKDLLRD